MGVSASKRNTSTLRIRSEVFLYAQRLRERGLRVVGDGIGSACTKRPPVSEGLSGAVCAYFRFVLASSDQRPGPVIIKEMHETSMRRMNS